MDSEHYSRKPAAIIPHINIQVQISTLAANTTFTCMTWCNVSITSFKLSILKNQICCKNGKNCWECFCYSIPPWVQFCATHHTNLHNLDIKLFSRAHPSDILFLTGFGLAMFQFIKINWVHFDQIRTWHCLTGNIEAYKDKLAFFGLYVYVKTTK